MQILFPTDLKQRFISTMSQELDFEYKEDNPFMIKYNGNAYLIYVKNISPAYFKQSPKITRVQLPYKRNFVDVVASSVPFIILGYDEKNDVYVNWDPTKIRQRLNSKRNVSLYSRSDFQENVNNNEFKERQLGSGDKIIIFHRAMLPKFFQYLETFFPHDALPEIANTHSPSSNDSGNSKSTILSEITDKKLVDKILPLLRGNRVLEAATICHNHYDGQFTKMGIKDWLNIVNRMYNRLNDESL